MEYTGDFDIPMTQLEIMLKFYLSQKPKKRILSSAEYSEYLAWMAKEHENHKEKRYTLDSIPVQIANPMYRDLADRIMRNSGDTQAFSLLSTGYEHQSEEQHILANHDISVGRMLRYMPALWHAADHFMIYYAHSGETTVQFKGDSIELKQGSVLILAPNALHANLCFQDDCVVHYFLVRASTFDRIFWNQLPKNSLLSSFFRQALSGEVGTAYLYFDTFADTQIRYYVREIIEEFAESRTYRSQMLNTLMSAFFLLLLRKYEGTARLPRTESFFWKHEFSSIFSYIQVHYADATIMDVADKFHYSKRQIGRIVQRYMGITYTQLILKLKMEEAASLLAQGNASIAAVSSIVGYSDVSSFYRAFTKYYHQTPVAFSKADHNN